MRKQNKAVLVLGVIVVFIGAAVLLPGLIGAGDPEPSTSPGPGTKKLDEILLTQSQTLPPSERFVAYANGVVYDKTTGLEWIAGPDKDTNWHEAKEWVETLTVGGSKWRMPTLTELKTLYIKGAGSRNMTPLLQTSGWWVWSIDLGDSTSAWFFCFDDGFTLVYNRGTFRNLRAFAVRSRK